MLKLGMKKVLTVLLVVLFVVSLTAVAANAHDNHRGNSGFGGCGGGCCSSGWGWPMGWPVGLGWPGCGWGYGGWGSLGAYGTVSYTHLDVYKRQVICYLIPLNGSTMKEKLSY